MARAPLHRRPSALRGTALLVLTAVTSIGCRQSQESMGPVPRAKPAFTGQAFLDAPPRWVRLGDALRFVPTLAPELAGAAIDLVGGPPGMVWDPGTQTLDWMPLVTEVGAHRFELEATLGTQTFGASFALTVVDLVPLAGGPVGPAGGSLQAAEVTVLVPPGALSTNATLSIGRYDGIAAPIDLPDAGIVGDFYDIELIDGGGNVIQPASDLTLTFTYDEAALPAGADESDIVIHTVGDEYEAWIVPTETSVVDTLANTVTVDTPHLSIWTTAVYYVPHIYVELASDGLVSVSYDNQILIDVPAARTYCETILATIQAAKVLAQDAGFQVEQDVTVRVFDIPDGNGYYNVLTGVIYIDSGLDASHLISTPTHEYFHAVTDLYYAMGAEKVTGLNWWFESLGAWFATLAEPDALKESVRGAPGGYLRAHLEERDKNKAYSKGTFIQFAEERVPNFVRTVFEANSTFNSTLAGIDALLPLSTGYAEYVAWAIDRYGPGSFRDLDGLLTLLSDGAVSYSAFYEDDGTLQEPLLTSVVDPDPITSVAQVVFDEVSRDQPYRSFVYRARVEAGTAGKQLLARLAATPLGADRGWVLAMRGDDVVSSTPLSPDGLSQVRTRTLGAGPADDFDSVVFVYPDTTDDGGRGYRWELDASEAPMTAEVELAVPADRETDSELRVLPPGGFDLPSIEVDLGADPMTPEWGMVVWTYQRQPFEIVSPMWQVFRVSPTTTSTVYGDPNLSRYNTANPNPIGVTFIPPGDLVDADFVKFQAFGCDGPNCSRRGERRVLYLDGPVSFTFTIDTPTLVPINGTEPATRVDLVATLDNQSSLPLVVNSVVARLGRGAQAFETELRLPQPTPLVVVPPGASRTFRFDDVQLAASSANWNTTQPLRLLIDRDNAVGLPFGDPNQLPALFFSEVFSDPVQVTVREPQP